MVLRNYKRAKGLCNLQKENEEVEIDQEEDKEEDKYKDKRWEEGWSDQLVVQIHKKVTNSLRKYNISWYHIYNWTWSLLKLFPAIQPSKCVL